jgi:hypothetical protein
MQNYSGWCGRWVSIRLIEMNQKSNDKIELFLTMYTL